MFESSQHSQSAAAVRATKDEVVVRFTTSFLADWVGLTFSSVVVQGKGGCPCRAEEQLCLFHTEARRGKMRYQRIR